MNLRRSFGLSCVLALFVGACAPTDGGDFVPRRRVADAGGAEGGGSSEGSLCERACARVYATCGRSLSDARGTLSRAQCQTACETGAIRPAAACLAETACTTEAIVGCFSPIPTAPDAGMALPPRADASAPPAPDASAPPPPDASAPPPPDASAPPPPPPPSAHSCATACGRIYDGCRVTLTRGGAAITRAECEAHCDATMNYRANVGCLSTMACTMDAFHDCLTSGR